MSSPLVIARDLARKYRIGATDIGALEACSFHVAAGDRIALVGPSGSGKSTLLHLLGGLDEPTSGTIEWPALGDRCSLRPSKISLIFQGLSLLPELSVVENVELPLILAGASASTARAAAQNALTKVDLAHLAAKLPQELSAGQAQRVAAARALTTRPSLILADEPTGQLDHVTAEQLVDALISAAEETNAALVFATHDAAMASRLQTLWQLEHGRLHVAEPVR